MGRYLRPLGYKLSNKREIMAIKLNNFEIGANKLTILAGPCAAESMDILRTTAEGLKKVCEELAERYNIKFLF